jgi:tetratricopeptide (TPR) repeat protein
MAKCVYLLLLVASPLACASSEVPRTEPPAQPLVIGTSPPPPVAPSASGAQPEGRPAPRDEAIGTTTSLAVPARDPRLALRPHPMSRAMLLAEIQGLEAMFATMATTAPDRPEVARRLAEDYAELARGEGASAAAAAHKKALSYYELIARDHPQYAHIDEAYYYAGLEHELAGNTSAARRAYYELIKTSPTSKLIPLAYFAFGEMFFAEAEADPSQGDVKNDLAEQAYREVVKYPPPGNAVHAEAKRRLVETAARRAAAKTIKRP